MTDMSRYGMLCKLSLMLLRLVTMVTTNSKSKFAFCQDFELCKCLDANVYRIEPNPKEKNFIEMQNCSESRESSLCNASVDQLCRSLKNR